MSIGVRTLRGALALALALCAAPAQAQNGDPLARGELVFTRHENGLQHPRYEPSRTQACAAAPAPDALRQRLIDLAVQEWARFGYPFSQRERPALLRARFAALAQVGKPAPYDENDPLLLQAVGGYWAALSGVSSGDVVDVGAFEIELRNTYWREDAAEWRSMEGWTTPWSAAFISWLMCEAGAAPFRRSWAHRDYVDAAIIAADGGTAHLYHARPTDRTPQPGDLLCSSRAGYRTDLEARRAAYGGQGEMHCDLVVARDDLSGLVLAIGGNVESRVTLVPYRLTRRHGRTHIRSVCRGAKVCPAADERLFALLVLQAPMGKAAFAYAPALRRAPQQPPPRFR